MPTDFSIHPGLLVHWAGKEFDCRCPDGSLDIEIKEPTRKQYLELLKNILKNGILMGEDDPFAIKCMGNSYRVEPVPRVCFTELKLSQCISHAQKYGALGIVVKRPFCFKRGGRPVLYYRQGNHAKKDVFLYACLKGISTYADNCKSGEDPRKMLQFIKPMGENEGEKFIYYDESEWRIVLTTQLLAMGFVKVVGESSYLPLDGWLSGIIYPDSETKYKAINCGDIRKYIKEICDIGHKPKSKADFDQANPPMEIPLNFCKQF